jgi:restriction system protein
VGQLWSLGERMGNSELVAFPLKTSGTVAIGRITGSYSYRDDLGGDFKHPRSVESLAAEVERDAFDQDLLYSYGAFLTVGRVQRDNAEQRVLTAVGVAASPGEEAADSEDDGSEAETSLDPAQLTREQIRQHISQTMPLQRTWVLVLSGG